MYEIHMGINGGWYGSVSADDPEQALSEALTLADLLAQLRSERPRPQASTASVPSEAPAQLTDKGAACLAYCAAHPRCTHAEYSAAGHTLRTVKWLRSQGYLHDVNGAWVVNYSPTPLLPPLRP